MFGRTIDGLVARGALVRWTVVVLLALAAAVVTCRLGLIALNSRWWPRLDIVDELVAPHAVRGWAKQGLMLADGTSVNIPGLIELSQPSELLQLLVRDGVEIDPDDGRVYGRLTLWHGCGGDPIRTHRARFDVAHMLRFLGRGTFDDTHALEERHPQCDRTLLDGWRALDAYGFRAWSKTRDPQWVRTFDETRSVATARASSLHLWTVGIVASIVWLAFVASNARRVRQSLDAAKSRRAAT